jgi:hypothetical protein
MEIYLNGNLVSTTNLPSGSVSNAFLATIGNTDSGAYPFLGKIDDVRVYNRALTDDDVLGLYLNSEHFCADPDRPPGGIVYNADHDIMQYCDGASWVAIGKEPPPCGGIGGLCADGSYYIGQVGGNDIYATAASESSQTWNNGVSNWTVTGFTSTTDGPGNTAGLVALSDAGAPYDAAEYCDGLTNVHGHSDWYLPAKDELNLFWNGSSPVAGVNTSGSWYWSSTEISSSNAWIHRFSDGLQTSGLKSGIVLVRCVRR